MLCLLVAGKSSESVTLSSSLKWNRLAKELLHAVKQNGNRSTGYCLARQAPFTISVMYFALYQHPIGLFHELPVESLESKTGLIIEQHRNVKQYMWWGLLAPLNIQ